MADFENDLFISYATADNRHGWIDAFVQELREPLASLVRPAEPRIWWDRSHIEEEGALTDQIRHAIAHTRTLVVILSEHSVKSRWCQAEWRHFVEAFPDATFEKRIVLIDVGTVPLRERPAIFSDLRGRLFFAEQRKGDDSSRVTFGFPTPNTANEAHQPFFLEMARLARKLALRLQPASAPQPVNTQSFTIYVAEAADDVDSRRDEVVEYLASHAMVLPPGNQTMSRDAPQWDRQVSQWLDQAQLFVQLVGSQTGVPLLGTAESPVVRQFELAAQKKLPRLVWRRDQAGGPSELQAVLEAAQFSDDLQEFLQEIVRRAKSQPSTIPEPAVRRPATGPAVCLQVASPRDPQGTGLKQQLERANLNVVGPQLSTGGTSHADDTAEPLTQCDALVLAASEENRDWLQEQLHRLPRRLAVRRRVRQDPLPVLVVSGQGFLDDEFAPRFPAGWLTVVDQHAEQSAAQIDGWIKNLQTASRIEAAEADATQIPTLPFAPYPGLRAFEEPEAVVFFGREAQVGAILERLRSEQFVAVVGGSGSGKSSLVRAGVLPALRAGALGAEHSAWRILTMTPGENPLATLAAQLLDTGLLQKRWPNTVSGRAQLTVALQRSDRALIEQIRALGLPPGTRLLLLVDQFEEVFRLRQRDVEQSKLFVQMLLATAREPNLPCAVILTMRSEFQGECAEFLGLPEALNHGQYQCPRLNPEELRQAIDGPAEVAGWGLDRALANRLIRESAANPDQLPIVQHVLSRIWQAAQNRTSALFADATTGRAELTTDDYRDVGGLAGDGELIAGSESDAAHSNALSRHCDEAYLELADASPGSRELGPGHQPSTQQRIAQRLFCGLAEWTAQGQLVRRPRTVTELAQWADCSPEELIRVADGFRRETRTFLRCPAKTPGDALEATDVLDVTHEALLRQWERLAGKPARAGQERGADGWLQGEELARRRYRRLAEAAEGEATAGLLKDPELGFLDQWWHEFAPTAAWGNAVVADSFDRTGNFLERSRAATAAERQAAERRNQQELAKERSTAAKMRRFTQASLTLAAVATLCAVGAGWWYWKARAAETAANTAKEAAQKSAKKSQENETLAKEAATRAKTAEELATKAKEAAEQDRDLAQQQKRRAELLLYANALAYAQRAWSDGKANLAWNYLDSAQSNLRGWEYDHLYNRFSQEKTTFRGHWGRVSSVAYSPDGKWIVSGSSDKTLKVWDAATGQETLTLHHHYLPVSSLAYSPDGKWIVSGSEDEMLMVSEAATGQQTLTLEHRGTVNSVVYSPDGTRIVSGSSKSTLKVWDAKTGMEILTLTGHSDAVTSISYSPNGKWIVSGSGDNTLKVWDAATGQKTLTLTGHTSAVTSVAYSPDGKGIVSGSEDNTLKVWDALTGEEALTLTGHTNSVTSVAYSPDGRWIVSGSGDNTLKMWDAETGEDTLTLRGHTDCVVSVAYSPDGKQIVSGSVDKTVKLWDMAAVQRTLPLRSHTGLVSSVANSPDGTRIVSGSSDLTLKVWDATTGQETLTLTGHKDVVRGVAYSPDGRRIVSGSEDKTLKVWDAATGHNTLTLTGHTAPVHSVAYSSNGKQILSGSWDNTLKVWDAATGHNTLTLTGHTAPVYSVAYSPDGKWIVSGSEDKTLKVWDAATGQNTLTLTGHTNWIASVAYSPDGKRIVSGSWDNTLKVWDAKTGETTQTLKGHNDRIFSVAYSPDGKRIVSGSDDKTLKVWDTACGQETLTLTGHNDGIFSVAYSPDGTRIVSGSRDKTLMVWATATKQGTLTLRGHTAPVFSVKYSPDGKWIVSGSDDNTLKVWDVATGQATLTLVEHTEAVRSVAYSPDGKRIVSGSEDNTLKVWDAVTGQKMLSLPGKSIAILSVAYSPNGNRIASGSYGERLEVRDAMSGNLTWMRGHGAVVLSLAYSPDGTRIVTGNGSASLTAWDAATGQELLSLRGHGIQVRSVAFSPDGTRIVSGSADETLKVWNAATGQEMLTLKGHMDTVNSVAYSPDGKWIVSGSSDTTLKLWDAATGQEMLSLKGHTDAVNSVAYSPDGKRIVSGSGDNTLKLWDVATASPSQSPQVP
jgi:WD40 repeat protein